MFLLYVVAYPLRPRERNSKHWHKLTANQEIGALHTSTESDMDHKPGTKHILDIIEDVACHDPHRCFAQVPNGVDVRDGYRTVSMADLRNAIAKTSEFSTPYTQCEPDHICICGATRLAVRAHGTCRGEARAHGLSALSMKLG